jgi:hypothetical protein
MIMSTKMHARRHTMDGKRTSTRSAAIAAAVLLALGACAPDPTSFHEEEHVDRVELVSGGTTLAGWEAESDAWTGSLAVGVGLQTALVDVVFFDHDGEAIAFDPDHYLEVVVADGSVAAFEQDGPGAFSGRLRGLQAGATSIIFNLKHGVLPVGHLEEDTSPLPVTVS